MGIIKDSGFVVDDKSANLLSKFNWGAFGFTCLWGLGNGALGKTIPILICDLFLSIPFLNLLVALVSLGLRIYAGINGNKWAYEGRAWYDAQDFEDTQKRYATAFGIYVAVMAVLFLIALLFAIGMSAMSINKNMNTANESQTSEKTPLEEVVDDIITEQKMHGEFSGGGVEAAEYILSSSEFAQRNNDTMVPAKYTSNSVRFVSRKNPKFVYYTFLFVQEGKCNLKQKNCAVTMYQMGKPTGKIYYDNNGNKKQVKVVVKK